MMNFSQGVKTIFFIGIMLFDACIFAQQAQDSIPITLQKAIEIGLNESPTIRIANREIQSKKYYKSELIAAVFQDISLSGSYNRTIKKQVMTMEFGGMPMEIEVGTDNNYTVGLNVALPLVMPTIWQNIKLSKFDIELAIESARSSKISLIKEIKKAYYAVLMSQESYNVLKRNYANIELSNKLINEKYEQGLVSEFEKLRSDVQLKNQRPQITAAENAIAVTTMMLKAIMGVDLYEPLIFTGSLSDYEDEVSHGTLPDYKSITLENNSDLKQMDLNKNLIEITKKLIISSACPTLSLGGNYQFMAMNNNFKFSEYNWIPYSVIGLSLRVPIVSWAATSYKMKQNDLLLANIKDQKDYIEKNLRVSIQNNLNNINIAMEDLESNKETMMQAEKAYQIVQKQYELGMGTWLDLNSAELAMVGSKLTYYQSIYNYLTAYAELEAIMGK